MRKYDRNDRFFSTWNKDMSYVLGFFTADGCITNGNRVCIRINEKDIAVLEYIKDVMDLERPIARYDDRDSTMVSLDVRSTRMTVDLETLNVTPRKTYSIVAPPFIPDDMVSHYIRGYFDGDGSINLRRRKKNHQLTADAYMDTASEIYSRQIHNMLLGRGINNNVYRKEDRRDNRVPIFRVNMSGKSVSDFSEFIYADAPFRMARKYDKFQDYYDGRFTDCAKCGNKFFRRRIDSTLCDRCRGLLVTIRSETTRGDDESRKI